MADVLTTITESIASLGKSVDNLTHKQAVQIKRAKRLAIIAIAGFVLDILLTIGAGFLGVKAFDNANDIKTSQETIVSQQVQLRALQNKVSTEALCPLYEIFLKSYDPKSPAALEDPAQYEQSFRVIEKGAKVLQCKKVTKGK